jgi:hypothetical protein
MSLLSNCQGISPAYVEWHRRDEVHVLATIDITLTLVLTMSIGWVENI